MSNEKKLKTYCHRSECNATTTGFNHSNWKVCTVCKEEISDHLYSLIKEKETKRTKGRRRVITLVYNLVLWTIFYLYYLFYYTQ